LKNAIINAFGPDKILLPLASLTVWFVLTLFLSSQLFRWEPEAKIGRRAKLYVAATAIPFLLLGVWEARYGRVIAEEKVTMQRVDDSEKSDMHGKPKDKQQSTDPSKLDDSKPQQ